MTTSPILPGQTLDNPVTGERFTFTHTASSTGGELLAFDFALRAGGAVPIPHVHPVQTERFEVVEGRMRFRLGLRTLLAGPGDVVEVAPGVAHSFANPGPDEALLRVEVRPALAMERMLAEVVALAHAGRLTRRGLPRDLRELARLARTYARERILAGGESPEISRDVRAQAEDALAALEGGVGADRTSGASRRR